MIPSLLLLASVLVLGPARGESAPAIPVPQGRVPLRFYGPKEGLTSLNPTALAQDRDGLLWVGTQSGLYQFDGVRFHRFGLEEGLPATSVSALMVGGDGSLWVGTTMRGVVRYHQGEFEAVGPARGLPQAGIKGIAQGAGGRVWVASLDGLFSSPDGQRFAPVPGWPGGPATAVVASEGGQRVWVGTPKAVHAVSVEGIQQSFGVSRGVPSADEIGMAVDGRGTLWVRTPQTLLSLPAGATRFNNHQGLLPAARTPALHRDPSGVVYVNSNQGMHVLRQDGTPRVERFIKADSPYCAMVDQEGSLWIGTRPLARTLGGGAFEVYNTADGLPSNLMWGIHRSPDKTLWVGTQSGVGRVTRAGWELFPGTRGMNARCITSTADGSVWIGQRNGPPLRVLPDRSGLEPQGPASGFRARGVYGMLADAAGNLWLAQQEGGLSRGHRTAAGWRFEPVAIPQGSPKEDLFGIAQDAKGRIFVAGTHGLAVLDKGRWQRFTRQEGLRDTAMYQVAVLADGRIVAAYREAFGASILRVLEGRIEIERHLDKRAGLIGDHVYMLGVDAGSRLWLGTGTGASVLDGDRLDFFTTEDGLAGDDCDAWSFLSETDGTVWIGSNTGLSRFRPPALAPQLPALKSLIRELRAAGNPWPLSPASRTDIPRYHNSLEFQLSALTFLNEAQVEHQVRLLGLESEWQTLQSHHARYPALAPGHYTFQVRSRRRGGPWGPESSQAVQILPAWWERTWVKALAWMLPVALLVWAMRLRFQLLKRRNAGLEAKVEAATAEIRSKAEALERLNQRLTQLNEDKSQMLGIVAHDLRNPLQTIQIQAELLEGEFDPQEVDEGSREIHRIAAEMQEMIRRLLDLSHIEAGALDLQPVPVEPRRLVAEVVEQHFHKAAIKDINLEIQSEEGLPHLWADPFYLREVLDNLISNAVKFTALGPPTRSVRVVLKPGIIEVSDDGPGFTEEDLANVFGRFTRLSAQPTGGETSTGLGLNIVKTILEAMASTIELESAQGQGSTFRIRCPLAP